MITTAQAHTGTHTQAGLGEAARYWYPLHES